MQWHSWSEFWYMGGYAFYVWGSFFITALTVVVEIWHWRWQRRDLVKDLTGRDISEDENYLMSSS